MIGDILDDLANRSVLVLGAPGTGGAATKFPNRLYAACAASSNMEHKSFFWLEEADSSQTPNRQLFGEMRVPHTLKRGMPLYFISIGQWFFYLHSEGSKYILTVPKRCKLKHLQDQRLRLRMPIIEDLKAGEVIVSDTFGSYGEVCDMGKLGLYDVVWVSGPRSDHRP